MDTRPIKCRHEEVVQVSYKQDSVSTPSLYISCIRTQCRLLLPALLSLGLVVAVWRLGQEAASLLHPLQAASTLIR